MGAYISGLLNRFAKVRDCRLLMVGLDAAGKTTMVYQFKLGETITTIPTIGFNVEDVQYKNLRFSLWDIGGQYKIRQLWKHYYANTNGLIFVVDSSDRERVQEAREEIFMLLQQEELRGVNLLVYANKSDLPGALSVPDLTA